MCMLLISPHYEIVTNGVNDSSEGDCNDHSTYEQEHSTKTTKLCNVNPTQKFSACSLS